jgi:hypothetical protein
MFDPERDMDGVKQEKAFKIVYRVALYAEMSQDRNTVKIEAPTEEQALHRLRSMYPPDCVDIVSVVGVEEGE